MGQAADDPDFRQVPDEGPRCGSDVFLVFGVTGGNNDRRASEEARSNRHGLARAQAGADDFAVLGEVEFPAGVVEDRVVHGHRSRLARTDRLVDGSAPGGQKRADGQEDQVSFHGLFWLREKDGVLRLLAVGFHGVQPAWLCAHVLFPAGFSGPWIEEPTCKRP